MTQVEANISDPVNEVEGVRKISSSREDTGLPEDPEEHAQSQEQGNRPVSRGRILIVDDEPPILDLLRDFFVSEGFEVITEPNGYRAIVRVREQPFDLIFMDIRMPVSGVATVKQVLDMRPDTPVVMITGHADHELIQQALAFGARMCLMKPFPLGQVLAVADRILDEKKGNV